MSNTLIVADLHSQFAENKERIEFEIAIHHPQHIIFLGDYVDKREQIEYPPQQQDPNDYNDLLCDLNYFVDWYKEKKSKYNITCLVGNHDWSYISKRLPTQQTLTYIADEVKMMFDQLDLRLVANAHHKADNIKVIQYICSHAGLNQTWVNNFFPMMNKRSPYMQIDEINTAFDYVYKHARDYEDNPNKCGLNMLEIISKYRGGYDNFSSPIWCDMRELFLDIPRSFNQIIGHTNVKHPHNILNGTGYTDSFKRSIYACDTSNTGKCGMIALVDGHEKPVVIE